MKDRGREIRELTGDLLESPGLRRMKGFIQHGRKTTYDHAVDVAKMSLLIDGGLKAKSDKRALARGALLHDYFLYDWHNWGGHLHGFSHAEVAAKNAKRDFQISEKEEGIIRSHMWPLNITKMPRSREAWIVCIADKICSIKETLAR